MADSLYVNKSVILIYLSQTQLSCNILGILGGRVKEASACCTEHLDGQSLDLLL
jgi:hypothetical protein